MIGSVPYVVLKNQNSAKRSEQDLHKDTIKPDIFWVGGIDWNLRNFHGYITQHGTTYNSYLIKDKHITLVDTVKHYLYDEMIERIKQVTDPKNIEYIISNHVEMDHSGSLPKLMELIPNAQIITSPNGLKGLKRHYKKDWDFKVVKTNDTLNIGKKTLQFVHIPMVHWPDSMVTYIADDKLLLPNDAFGQHISSTQRFDDEIDKSFLFDEAAKYYANIVMPYGGQVQKALDAISSLDIDMIAPSHGLIWRSLIPDIINKYNQWSTYKSDDNALIIYDSMWGSTEKIAQALLQGLQEAGVPVSLKNLSINNRSDIITEVLNSKLILIGSPTLNNNMLPSMGGFLTYLKGLKPLKKIGFVFGSYGWGGQAVGQMEEIIKALKWDLPFESINLNYIPDTDELKEVEKTGKKIGNYLKKRGE
jgi:flavorubredoxin